MTRRTLLIASFSLAREHSVSFECNSACDILKNDANCLSEGSNPNFSFSLNKHETQLVDMINLQQKKGGRECKVVVVEFKFPFIEHGK